jgi:hypothetical protein
VLQVGPRELEQLLEYLRRLLLVERPHGGGGRDSRGWRSAAEVLVRGGGG